MPAIPPPTLISTPGSTARSRTSSSAVPVPRPVPTRERSSSSSAADSQFQDLPGQPSRSVDGQPAPVGRRGTPSKRSRLRTTRSGIGPIEDRPHGLRTADGLEADHDRRLLEIEQRRPGRPRSFMPGVDPQVQILPGEFAIERHDRVAAPRWHQDRQRTPPAGQAGRGRLGPAASGRKRDARCFATVDNGSDCLRRRGQPARA